MSLVYEVRDRDTASDRALKVLSTAALGHQELKWRFTREASIGARLRSPHIVELVDSGVISEIGAPYLVMERLVGLDLELLLQERGRLSVSETLLHLAQVAHALDEAHAAGVVHRDLKPSNVFITSNQHGEPLVKVLDFGIAKLLSVEQAHRTNSLLGSPLFMAPEQVRFKREAVDTRADIYSFGQLAYCMLVGEPYWQPDNEAADSVMQLVLEIAFGTTQAASDRARERQGVELTAAFDRWFATATALRAADRFSSAGGAVSELAHALSCSAPPVRTVAAPSRSGEVRTHWVTDNRDARDRATRWKRLASAGLALGALAGLFSATALSTRPTPSSVATSAAFDRFARLLAAATTTADATGRGAIGAPPKAPPKSPPSTAPRPPDRASTTSEPRRAPNARPASAAAKRPPSPAPASTGPMPAETPPPPAWVAPVTER
jgi:serine/threonine-protein kinase